MENLTLHQLQCFDSVVTEGGFQAAGAKLRRSHPAVYTAVQNLETELGLALFDRSGYRVGLTEAGRSLHARARLLLREIGAFRQHAAHLAIGEEPALTVVIGDLCPLPEMLELLQRFFEAAPGTRLHLHFEVLSGPWERLMDGEADLILHYVDRTDPRIDFVDLLRVDVIPVVAPGFLRPPLPADLAPDDLRDYVQCVIRDTARHSQPRDHFILDGARSWTVSDQLMKRQIILRGLGWGHLPSFLVAEDIAAGRLVSIAGKHLRGTSVRLVAARRHDKPHGPVATRLWRYIEEQARVLATAWTEGRVP